MTAKSFVVVDRSRTCGADLRDNVVKSGDVAHVFNAFAPALELIRRKRIDTVLVEFDTDKETTKFCAAVHALGIPVIFLSTPVRPLGGDEYGFVASFPALPNAPKLPVQYVHHQ